MSNMAEWLTPTLIGAGCVILGWQLASIAAMRRDLAKALQQLVKHETILRVSGLLNPHGKTQSNID